MYRKVGLADCGNDFSDTSRTEASSYLSEPMLPFFAFSAGCDVGERRMEIMIESDEIRGEYIMKTNTLLKQIRQEHASAFTYGGKFHADDVFSAALLLYLNPEITITRGIKCRKTSKGLF